MAEMLNNLQKRSVIELIDELNVAVQSLKIASSSETLVTLHKKLDILGSLVAKSEYIIELSEKERSEVQAFISEFRQSMLEFKEEMDKVDLSKLDEFCNIFERFSDKFTKDISLYREVTDETNKEIGNLQSSLSFTKWTSVIVGICLGIGGFLLHFGAIVPLKESQQEIVATIGENSDRFRNLLLQRQIDLNHIKELEAASTQMKGNIDYLNGFVGYLSNNDEVTLLINQKNYNNYLKRKK